MFSEDIAGVVKFNLNRPFTVLIARWRSIVAQHVNTETELDIGVESAHYLEQDHAKNAKRRVQ